ncbi:hypothetical protein IWW43_002954 [Coemansia sp. RSA 1935]|nr:hypothetical protein IWW43_002954 [Coemansia sp. RSA 1935]
MGYSANTDCQVCHVIDTNTATPIARAPYRVGETQLQELHKQLADLLERELIRPSVSAWDTLNNRYSPFYMVHVATQAPD